tara:strand:- start:372 stop:518 length:147 start_codon:yes stop_codon:yes gene_type:complete
MVKIFTIQLFYSLLFSGASFADGHSTEDGYPRKATGNRERDNYYRTTL